MMRRAAIQKTVLFYIWQMLLYPSRSQNIEDTIQMKFTHTNIDTIVGLSNRFRRHVVSGKESRGSPGPHSKAAKLGVGWWLGQRCMAVGPTLSILSRFKPSRYYNVLTFIGVYRNTPEHCNHDELGAVDHTELGRRSYSSVVCRGWAHRLSSRDQVQEFRSCKQTDN